MPLPYDRAACKNNPAPFHNEQHPQEALAICRGCPVTQECLDLAMRCEEQGYRHGIYGGTTPEWRDRHHNPLADPLRPIA